MSPEEDVFLEGTRQTERLQIITFYFNYFKEEVVSFYFLPSVDLDLTPDFDARKDKTPEECHKDDGQAHSIQDPPLIITSDSHGTIPRISAAGRVDQEGRLTLVSVGSSFEYSSSVSSTASVRSDENVKAVMATYNESIAAEFVRSESLTEDCKKVSFACEKSESRKVVKRRATKIHDGESAVKRTEHTLVCSAGSSWFTQVSWDESLDDNGNDIEDISGRLQEGVDQLRGFNSGSDTKDSDVGKTRCYWTRCCILYIQ